MKNYVKNNATFVVALLLLFGFILYQRVPLYLASREKVDRPAPNFTLKDIQGREHSLSDYAGKVVLLNFWATWCGPCLVERPILNNIYEELKGEDFEILAVTQEDREHVTNFLKNNPMNYPVLIDDANDAAEKYDLNVFPTLVFIDRKGVITEMGHGLDFLLKWKLRLKVKGEIF